MEESLQLLQLNSASGHRIYLIVYLHRPTAGQVKQVRQVLIIRPT